MKDKDDMLTRLGVHGHAGRRVYPMVMLRGSSIHERIDGFDLTKQIFLRILDGQIWVTPSVATHGASALSRRVARQLTASTQHGAACGATLTALSMPDVLGAIVARLPWSDRAAAALTCAAFAAAVHAPGEAWRTVLLEHAAPALAARHAAQLGTAAAALFPWRSLAAAIATAQALPTKQTQLLAYGNARFQRRWERAEACDACRSELWGMHPCALCEEANDRMERGFAADAPTERLSDFTFMIEVTHKPPPPVADAADAPGSMAPNDSAEKRLLFCGACVMPRTNPDGVIGSGLHTATLHNALQDDAAFITPSLPDSTLDSLYSYPERAPDAPRDAAKAWVKGARMTLSVQRRSDGAVAQLSRRPEAADVYSFDAPEMTLHFRAYGLFDPLLQPQVSWTFLPNEEQAAHLRKFENAPSRVGAEDMCHMHATVELVWRVARAPRTLAQHFPSATLRFDASRGGYHYNGDYGLLEEQLVAMLSVLDWAL